MPQTGHSAVRINLHQAYKLYFNEHLIGILFALLHYQGLMQYRQLSVEGGGGGYLFILVELYCEPI